MDRKKSAAEVWIDDHREFLLLALIIPIGKIVSVVESIIAGFTYPDPADHQLRVERIRADVEHNYSTKTGEMLRTDRKSQSSLNVRASDKTAAKKIAIRGLRSILEINTHSMTVTAEPFVTIGDLVKFLDKRGYELTTAIEMKKATIGGLVLALGMTTSSHKHGLMSDIVQSYEIVSAEGKVIKAVRDGENGDLFRAIPWSHGTLGFLTSVELSIQKAPKYVKLVYRPFYNLDEYCKEHTRLLHQNPPCDYLEGQVFGKNRAVIIEGYRTDRKDAQAKKVNNINLWYKPFFYKHVESMLSLGEGKTYSELVPNAEYLMRHDRSMCMTMGKIIPHANHPLYRALLGWMLPPNMSLLKGSRPQEERNRAILQQVYQDIGFPSEHLKELLEHLDGEFEIYPLLVYPCKVFDYGGMVRHPGEHGKQWDGTVREKMYLNLGIYGFPKAVRNGDKTYRVVEKVREVEAKIASFGGFLHTYVDIFTTEEEFHTMFDHGLWNEMRKKYKADGVFPSIYDKVKPELNPIELMEEAYSEAVQEG